MTDQQGGGLSIQPDFSSKSTMVTLAACVVVFVGSFLTWASLGGINLSGTSEGMDGVITLVVAIATAVAAVFLKDNFRTIAVVVGGAVVVLVAIIRLVDILDSDASIGAGLYLVLIGGVASAAAAFITE